MGLKKSKLRKNTDIPNSYPFKKEVLQAIQIKKELEQEEKLEKRQAKKIEKKRKRESGDMEVGSVEALQRRAQMKQMEYESKTELTAGDDEQVLLLLFNIHPPKLIDRYFMTIVFAFCQ